MLTFFVSWFNDKTRKKISKFEFEHIHKYSKLFEFEFEIRIMKKSEFKHIRNFEYVL